MIERRCHLPSQLSYNLPVELVWCKWNQEPMRISDREWCCEGNH